MIRKQQIQNYLGAKKYFTIIPNELCSRPDVTPFMFRIWCYLMSEDPNWESSRNNIARNLRMSPNSVSRCMKKLEKLNMLKVTKHKRREAWDFDIIDPSQWVNPNFRRSPMDPVEALKEPYGSRSGSPSDPHTRNKNKNKNGFVATSAVQATDSSHRPLDGGRRAGPDMVKSEAEKADDLDRFQRTIERLAKELEARDVRTP